MKNLICTLLFGALLIVPTFAQKISNLLSRQYKSHLNNGFIKQYLDELHQRTGIIIEYANNLETDKNITLDGSESSIGALLQKVLYRQRVRLIEKNNKLILAAASVELNTDKLVPVYSLYGFVKEEVSMEPLIDATIFEPSIRRGIVTNAHGYFSVSLTEGKHRLEVSYTGYEVVVMNIEIHSDTRNDFLLTLKQRIQKIVITAENAGNKNGSDKILANQYMSYNYLLGENDPIRATYLLPGVRNVRESFNGILVRGGGTDENLFLLDGNPVYNPTHMLGALSIVNQTSMKSMKVFKSFFPSQYAGALSSVIDVNTKDGNMEEWVGEANIGVLAGAFTLEGPVVKNKTAIMTSYRRSWSSPVLNLFQKGIKPDFYDFHFKATHLLNVNNKLIVNYYQGRDQIIQQQENLNNLHKWGNRVASLGWNHVVKSNIFVNSSINMTGYNNLGGYKYTLSNENGQVVQYRSLGTFSSIDQYNAKTQVEIYATNKVKFNVGAKIAHTIIKPFDTKLSKEVEVNKDAFKSFEPLPFNEWSAYSETELKLSKRLFVRPGLHLSYYQFEEYKYLSLQPRFYTSYQLSRKHRIFAAYNKMTQYLHLVTNPYLGVNSDIWVPSTEVLKPEESKSYTIGYAYKNKKGLKLTIDGYWKRLNNVTNYAEGKSYFINESNWQQNIQTGMGWSYGLESMFDKTKGKLTMHASYTLSWSWRQFKGINNNNMFPYKYDRRHDLNLGLAYRLGKHVDLSMLWSFATGDVFTLPGRIYPDYDNSLQISNPDDMLKDYRFIYHYSGLNEFRNPNYHRLDIAANYHTSKLKKIQSIIVAGIYNIYGSPDQFRYDLKGSLNNKSMIIISNNTLFNITPYMSYTVKF